MSAAPRVVRSMRTRTLLFLAFGAIVAFTFARLAFGVRKLDIVIDDYHARVQHNVRVEEAIERVDQMLFDSETALRGWLLTHDRRFLEPYERATTVRESTLGDLVSVESDQPEAKAVAERIVLRAHEWTHSVGDPEVDPSAKPMDPAQLLSLQLFGKARMDMMRADIAELRGNLNARHLSEEQTLADYRQDLVSTAVGGSVILALLIIALGWLVASRIDTPLGELVDYVESRRWEKADRKPLAITGVHEIETLALLMEEAAERGNAESERVKQFTALVSKLAEGGTVDQVAEIAVRWCGELLGALGAVIWIAENDTLRIGACFGVDRDLVESAGSSKAMNVLRTGKTERFENLTNGGRVLRTAIVDVDPKTLVVLPVRAGLRVVAVLELAGDDIDDGAGVAEALDRVGFALEAAIANTRVQGLGAALASANDELRAQNEELRAQEEELRTQSEELVEKQKELARTNVELEKGSRLKNEFLSDMSHELRTPLNAVIGFSELLLGDTYGQLAPTQRDRVTDIATAGRQLLALVNDILDLSRIEAGRVELKVTDIDLRSTVEDACTLMVPIADQKKVTVDTVLPPSPLVVAADPDRVRQVMVNLLSNAIKFTPASGRVELRASAEDGMARIEVRDTGIGISAEDARKLFAPFTQLKGGVSAGGAGLGLSISKRLVELMAGEIGLESTVGKGSVFYFKLPLSSAARPEPIRRRSSGKIPAVTLPRADQGRRVLVVENDPNGVRAAEEILVRAGHTVRAASSANDARSELARFAPDLVVVDLGLPGGSGFSFVEKLAADKGSGAVPKKTAIVALTDRALTPDERAKTMKAANLVAEKGVMTGAGFLDAIAGLLEETNGLKKRRILVIDDSAINRSVLRAMLESAGFEVTEADRAKEGILMAQAAPPQVILMDVRMPDMSGLEATKLLRADARTAQTPVIAVSAQAMTGDRELALEAGCLAYVTKPVARQELLTAIGDVLQNEEGE